MIIVLDTNVFISGIYWSGDSERILNYWFDNRFEVICSIKIIEEIIKTLMNFKVQLEFNNLLLWINIISGKSVIIEPIVKLNVVKDDPDDNKFIEAAVTGKADYIITQDNHLLRIGKFQDVEIMTPSEFLKLI